MVDKQNGMVKLQVQSESLLYLYSRIELENPLIFCLYSYTVMLEVSLWITLTPIPLYHCEKTKENES